MTTALLVSTGLATSLPVQPSEAPPSVTTYPEVILAQNPVHYWRLVDTSDDGSSPATLTNVNSVPFSGRPPLVADDDSGGSASFDGDGSAPGHFTQAGAPDGLTSSTWHFVVQPDKLKTKHIVANVEDDLATFDDALGIELVDNGAGALRPRIYRETGSGLAFATGAAGVVLPTNALVTIDVVFGASSLLVYVDGAAVGLDYSGAALPSSWPAFTSSTLYLGVYKDGTSQPLQGLMAEVAIYASALDAGTIATLSTGTALSQAVYFAALNAGTIGGTGSIDPAAQATTHPKSGLTAIEDSDPDDFITVDGGVWDYDTTAEIDGAISFTGSISIGGVTSTVRTISATVSNPTQADTITVPLLTGFLANDDEAIPGTGTIRYAVVGGAGVGGDINNPGDLQTTVSAMSPGDMTVARGGSYDIQNGLTFPNGTDGNLCGLMAYPGETVVISAGEDFAAARSPNSSVWVASGEANDAAEKIWKSASRMGAPGENARMYGGWVEGGHLHHLLSYQSLAHLRVDKNESPAAKDADGNNTYDTPGVWMQDGFVYIRMQIPAAGLYSPNAAWRSGDAYFGWPEAVSAGELAFPLTEDPNDYVIYLFRRSNARAMTTTGGTSGGYIRLGSGVNTLGYHSVISRGHDIQFGRGLDFVWRNAFLVPSDAANLTEVYANRRRWTCGSKLHGSRALWKFDAWALGDRGAWMEFVGGDNGEDVGGVTGFYAKDCTIHGFHEIIVGKPNKFRFRNCDIVEIVDDGIQGNPKSAQVEFGYCYFLNAAMGGNQGSGTAADAILGQYYFHHNIMDIRGIVNTNWGADTHPHYGYLNHSASGNQPKKMYNCTLLYGPDAEEEQQSGFSHHANQDNTKAGATYAHEQFNNIYIRHDTQRYEPDPVGGVRYSDGNRDQSDWAAAIASCNPNASNYFTDYNLIYRDVPTVGGAFSGFQNGLLERYRNSKGSQERQFATLAAFYADSHFALSKTGGSLRDPYVPGFEGNSTETKPTLASLDDFPASRYNYRPSAQAQVTTSTTSSLSGADWWTSDPSWGDDYFGWSAGGGGLAPSAWKGALDPSGSTITVGVQNP